jgi:hypothetical protein
VTSFGKQRETMSSNSRDQGYQHVGERRHKRVPQSSWSSVRVAVHMVSLQLSCNSCRS